MAIKKVDIFKDSAMIFDNGVRLYDKSIAKLVFSHMRIKDILNPFKIVQATLEVASILGGKTPKAIKQKFKYNFK